ncbi:MFS transporter [Streptomyces sp. 8K308]|uniref:MFS transporter n=1 Tax=Streptomyces sp. 8K308 TaxID=2530388 RepID=UPI001043B5E4|nr:MFS transporter [Streptomyces sp. 8K308]TDC25362.1 MFS transporter [Streptomyces sp. 8K308]
MVIPQTDARAPQREARTLLAAALTNGPAELVDFLLPLWAGIALGAGPTEIGVLVALEVAVSVVVRPLAGVLTDTRDRRRVAAFGAAAYGVACAGYAFAGSLGPAYGAAVLSGVGGALLWVAVRAIVGERLAADSGVYPRLMAARENGSWIAFVAGMSLMGVIDFTGVFLGCAVACLLAAGALLASPDRDVRPPAPGGGGDAAGLGGLGRRLRPMLLAVAFTMTAEAAVGMLLLLHLQNGFDLDVVEVALVFLPGAIVSGLLPGRLHAFVVRFGRARVVAVASVASAGFALSLSWAPGPHAIAALWILSGVAWAAVLPVQEAVIAEVAGEHTGRGMGLYEAAALVGSAIGALAAGVLYDTRSWTVACVVASGVILAGALITPGALRALRVTNFPPPPPPAPSEPVPAVVAPPQPPAEVAVPAEAPAGEGTPPRRHLTELGGHALLFALAQGALAIADLCWIADLAAGDAIWTLLNGSAPRELSGAEGLLYGTGRVWTFVLLGEAVVRGIRVVRAARRGR